MAGETRTARDNFLGMWRETSMTSRIVAGAVILGMVGMLTAVAWWSLQPSYVTLIRDTDPQSAMQIADLLDTEGIDYQMTFSGKGIMVDQSKFHRANALAAGIVPQGNLEQAAASSGSLWTSSPSSQFETRILQKQLALEKAIGRLEGVRSATVQLAIPEESPFEDRQQELSASVTVDFEHGIPGDRKIASAITFIVAKSVPGMLAENVAITDTRGNVFQGNGGDMGVISEQMEIRQAEERDKKQKIESLLNASLGPGKFTIAVTVEKDFVSTERRKKILDPKQKAVLTEDSTTTKALGTDPLALGNVGIGNNLPAAARAKTDSDVVSEGEQIKITYDVGHEELSTIDPGGKNTRVTVAAVVQLTPDPSIDARSTEDGAEVATTSAPPEPIMTVEQVEAIIRDAINLVEGRDEVTVVSLEKLGRDEPLLAELLAPPSTIETILPLLRNGSLGLAALVALFLGMKTVGRLRPVSVPEEPGNAVSPEQARRLADLSALARKNPELLSNIMAAWINDARPKSTSSGSTKKAA